MAARYDLDHAAYHAQQSLQVLHLWDAPVLAEDVGRTFGEIIEIRIRNLHALQAREAPE